MLLLVLLSFGGCDRWERGCLHRDLDDWCWHQESEEGPVPPEGGGTCETPSFDPDDFAFRCGDLDVSSSGPNFTGRELYFDHNTGELVAVRYWSDVNRYCDSLSYWYGRRVLDCEPECTYGDADSGLPACD